MEDPWGCDQVVKQAYKEGIAGWTGGRQCPFTSSELKQRCAWMAGYQDARNGVAF